MDGLHVLMANVFLAGLLVLVIPTAALSIHILFHQPPSAQRIALGLIGGIFSITCFALAWNVVIDVQDVNPVCAGIGDPHVTLCFEQGLVPHAVGVALTQAKRNRDLLYCLVIPTLGGMTGLLAVFHMSSRSNHHQSSTRSGA